MTLELNISLMNMLRGQDKLMAVLNTFEEEQGIHVNLTTLEWSDGWAELLRYATNEKGPDVSEIGSSWLPTLVSMNVLPPFSLSEQQYLGGEETFSPRAWRGVVLNERAYAMPWFCDARLLYYRRDLLEQANLSPEQAFSSLEAFYQTLETLHNAGNSGLWAIPTARHVNNVHLVASWIWGYGGDFFSPDGRKLILDQPEALRGLTRYFETTRFIANLSSGRTDQDLIDLFIHGQLAMLPSGPWLANSELKKATPEVLENWGVVSMPGVPFVGGTHLSIWRHSRKRDIALELLRYLCSEKVQTVLHFERGFLPVNQKALEAQRDNGPVMEASMDALRAGRFFPLVPVWSKVEDRLVAELNGIWADVLEMPVEEAADPDAIRKIVETRICSFVKRLNLVITS